MSRFHVNLPGAQMPANAMLNTDGLNQAIQGYHKRNENAMLRADRLEEQQHQRSRNAMKDGWAAEDRTRESFERDVRNYANYVSGSILTERDPAKRAQLWTSFLGSNPNLANAPPEFADPAKGPELFMSMAEGHISPLDRRYKEAQIQKLQREAKDAGAAYGKSGSIFQGADGKFYSVQFGSDGSRAILPLEIPGQSQPDSAPPQQQPMVDGGAGRFAASGLAGEGQPQSMPLTPARGVMEVGDTLVDKSTGGVVRNVGESIAAKKRQEKLGEWEGGSPQRDAGAQRLDSLLAGIAENYLDLDKSGAIVNTDKGTWENIGARLQSSEVGQAVSGAVGTKEQSIRQRINNSRPLLMQSIMQATGMSARALDSNKELEFYLQAVSDPKRDLTSNLAAIDALDKAFGLGDVLKRTLPPDVYAKVSVESSRQLAERPINLSAGDEGGGPSPGTILDGYMFKGGNPADQANWEPI